MAVLVCVCVCMYVCKDALGVSKVASFVVREHPVLSWSTANPLQFFLNDAAGDFVGRVDRELEFLVSHASLENDGWSTYSNVPPLRNKG